MTPLEYFRLFATEFAALADATVGGWLTIADGRIETAGLDDERAAQAVALYAAHLLKVSTVAASGSAGGTVTSEREGDLSRSYAVVKGSDTETGSTPYGLQYLELTRVIAGASIMTRFA